MFPSRLRDMFAAGVVAMSQVMTLLSGEPRGARGFKRLAIDFDLVPMSVRANSKMRVLISMGSLVNSGH